METHYYDGPTDLPPEKRQIQVNSMSELRRVAAQLIESGETDVNVQIPIHMMGPEAYDILGQIVSHHPASKQRPHAQEAEVSEVVSYSEQQEHRGIHYSVFEAPDGFRVKVAAGCAGMIEPWDCPFQDYEDAALHGRAFIDQVFDTG